MVYVTQAALDEIAFAHRAPRVDRLVWPHGAFDSVVYHLGQTLLSSLERTHHVPKIFLDHVLQALNSQVIQLNRYGFSTSALSPMRSSTEHLTAAT